MTTYYPPVGFYFNVQFSGVSTAEDANFAEVTGLEIERPMLEIREGGENRYAHRVPERARFGNLVLRRGLLVWDSDLSTWCSGILESDLAVPLTPKDIDIALMDEERQPLMSWSVKRAWPLKWNVTGLAADKSELAIETLELAYANFTRGVEPHGRRYLRTE